MAADPASAFVIRFPDRQVGRLRWSTEGDRRIVPARGVVEVPAGASVELKLERLGDHGIDLEVLEAVPADALTDLALKGVELGDTDSPRLARFPRLRSLTICGSVTAGLVAALAPLAELTAVRLDGPDLGDDIAAALAGLRLTNATVDSAVLTDVGLASLAQAPTLATVTVEAPLVTDEGARCLRRLPGLRGLTLASPLVTGSFLEEFAGSAMNVLNLTRSGLDDEQLASLARLPLLMICILDRTPLTDAAVAHLAASSSMLQELLVRWTGITEAGLTQLHRLRPDLSINCVRYTLAGLSKLFPGDAA